jgi:hypothetical protein
LGDTPFHHQARLEGVGVDCVGLVISVAREMGAVPADWDVGGYGRVPDGKRLVHHLSERLVPVAQRRHGARRCGAGGL